MKLKCKAQDLKERLTEAWELKEMMEHDDALETVKIIYWNHLNERHGCSDMVRDGCDEWRNRNEDEGCKHTRLIARLMDEKFGTDKKEDNNG